MKPPETRIEEGGEGLQGRRLDGWLGNIPDIGQLPILGVPCIEGDSLRGGLHAGNLHFESEAARVLPVGYAARDEGNAREVELVHEGTHSLLADEGSLVVEVLVEDVVVHQSQPAVFVGFELATDGIQFYVFANSDKTSLRSSELIFKLSKQPFCTF